jgi:hypothetical protein
MNQTDMTKNNPGTPAIPGRISALFLLASLAIGPGSIQSNTQTEDCYGPHSGEAIIPAYETERSCLCGSTTGMTQTFSYREEMINDGVISDGTAGKAVISCRESSRWPDITMVRITVPFIPGLQFDVWCYENEPGVGECFPQPDGTMILKHHHPGGAFVETKIVPSERMIDWYVTVTGPTREAVQSVEWVNPCWQFRHAPGFRSLQGQYVESFVNRCFVYTEDGFTLFGDTKRYPDIRYAEDDYRNHPVPWVQSYFPIWNPQPGKSYRNWGISDSQPVYSIIGIVSRDKKYLVAWGGAKSNRLSQGWHDCLHLRPLMIDYDEKENRILSHSRIYFMENDPDKLLEQYKRDFIDRF